MKHTILFICYITTTLQLHGKILHISPTKRTSHYQQHQEQQQQQDLHQLLTSCEHHTVLIETRTAEESLALLAYLPTLKDHNKTIIYKAPEDMLPLLSWCPYIDHLTSNNAPVNYSIKITGEQLVSSLHIDYPHATNKYLLVVNDTAEAAWNETFCHDTKFKIGLYFKHLYSSCILPKHTATPETFFPLGLLQNISLYSFDNLCPDKAPNNMTLYQIDQHVQKSLTNIAAVIQHMQVIITTEPIIAYIAEALGKMVWLIVSPESRIDFRTDLHPCIELITESTNERLLCSILRKLSSIAIHPKSSLITAEIAIGELIDKITILEIKAEQITDETKLENIYRELQSLQMTCDQFITPNEQLRELTAQLKKANHALWITEDLIRDKEREKLFDEEFIALARSVYIQNDERCRVKRSINELLGSRLIEEKSYKPYN